MSQASFWEEHRRSSQPENFSSFLALCNSSLVAGLAWTGSSTQGNDEAEGLKARGKGKTRWM